MLILCPVDPCSACEQGWCTRRCSTTPGVRACGPRRMRARLVRSAPPRATSPVPPQSYTRATRSTCGCEAHQGGQATLTGIITVSWRMEAKVKRTRKEESGKSVDGTSNRELPGGIWCRGFRVKVNSRDSARTQGNTPVKLTDFLTNNKLKTSKFVFYGFKLPAQLWGIKSGRNQ